MIKYILLLAFISSPVLAGDQHLHKRVFLSQQGNKLIAVDARSSRAIELPLRMREKLRIALETEVVVAAATDQRLLAFSIKTGWKPFKLRITEKVFQFRASNFSIFAETNERVITFSGKTGKWAAHGKPLR
jgi:hypothetical protein